MYRTELNERSPMRVFECSMHGGLGRGNVGVVASGPGVGKTALLVQIALDDLLRDRRVLHISREHAVDHVRAFYDERFHDLARRASLSDPGSIELDVERHRLIHSLLSQSSTATGSRPGEAEPISKIAEVVRFAREEARFEPDVIVVDGFDLVHDSREALAALHALARKHDLELWFAANARPLPDASNELPPPLDEFADLLDVVVYLQPEDGVVRLRLLKEHDAPSPADPHLRLDPHTLRIVDERARLASERPRLASQFRLVSGGSKGAEAEFGACAEHWGMTEVNYSFEGHPCRARTRGVVVLGSNELSKGDFSLVYVSRRLGRELTDIPAIRHVLQTIWHQIMDAREVFAVGVIQDDGTVRGGTGWGVELARLWKKPVFVFDQERAAWHHWTGARWEIANRPTISRESFAGIGTQQLNDVGRRAIRELFVRTFDESE